MELPTACISNEEDSKSFSRKSFCSWKNSSKAPFGSVGVGWEEPHSAGGKSP